MITDKKFVIWDWNGTLFNDARTAHAVYTQMQRKRGIPETSFEDYQRFYEHPIELLYQRGGFDIERESFDLIAHEWHALYVEELPSIGLQHDAQETLETFHLRKMEQVVLSALPHNILMSAIEGKGVKDFFLHIQGLADQAGRSKIENGHALMKKWGVNPAETVLIGDSTHDFETAQALEIDCVLVSRGFEHRDKLTRHGVRVLDDFSELR